MLRGAGTLHERLAAMEEAERVREQEREARGRKLDAVRAAEAEKGRAEGIKAGRVYEPVGGWDRDASDALGALFSSNFLWQASVARRGGGDSVTVEQVLRCWWALNLIAENGGEFVNFTQNRPPRGGISTTFSESDLRHLSDLGLVSFVKAGGLKHCRGEPGSKSSDDLSQKSLSAALMLEVRGQSHR